MMTPAQNPPSLRYIIQNAVHWRELAPGRYNAYLIDPSEPEGPRLFYPVQSSALGHLHADLPLAVQAMFDFAGQMSCRNVPGRTVSNTLLFLDGGCIQFQDTRGLIRTSPYVTSLGDVPGIEHCIIVSGMFFDMKETVINGKNTSFVTKENSTYFFATSVDLEQRYPGFMDRWKFGTDLDLAGPELCQHVFGSSSAQSCGDLTGLTFE